MPNRAAPMGGPASWLVTMIEPISRALAMPSPCGGTASATSAVAALSARVSAVPSRNTTA